MSKDLGKSTSYAYYVDAGGTKTPQEYGEMLVNIDTVATRAEDAADAAAESATGALNSKNAAQTAATTATNKASEATTAATTATTKAGEASTSASTATSAKDTAVSASQTATTKATEATTAAATAVSAKDDAVSANTAAQSAKTAAQTAQTGAETAAASVEASAEQIATNTEDISQLKSEFTDFAGLETTWETGFWTNQGAFNSDTNFKHSNYIPIKELAIPIHYTVKVVNTVPSYILFDEQKHYIKKYFDTDSTSLVEIDDVVSDFEGATYVVFESYTGGNVYTPALRYCNVYDSKVIGFLKEITLDDIPNKLITQDKLSFADLVLPTNLFDYTNLDCCIRSTWYYSTTIGSVVSPSSNSYTVPYVAIKIPLYEGIEKVTFGIYPNVLTRNVFWVGAVDADMKLINYQTVNTQPPITYTIPSGAKYLLVSYNLNASNFDTYIPTIMAVSGETITGYSEYNDPYYLLKNCKTDAESVENSVTLKLPDAYDLVVGDTFELFYKGVINAANPDMYDIVIDCASGHSYSKRFRINHNAAGNVIMNVSLYGINHNVLDAKQVTLKVNAKASSPSSQVNILCVGDSLTTGGVWVKELYRRLTGTGGTPEGDGLTNINFIGTRESNGVHYEGYGGWTFTSYNTENVSNASKIITCSTHDKTSADQHSIYKDSTNATWKLETIESGQIKIMAVSGEGNNFPATGTLTWVSGGVNHSDIVYTASTNAAGNPFWNESENKVDFASYASDLGVDSIDFVYVLLGWNSASSSENDYKTAAQTFIDNVHNSFPDAKIVLIGLQIPARDGLGVNYASSGIYSRYYDLMQFVFNLDKWYDDLVDDNTNVYHINLAGQFDTEHNMPTGTRTVNDRNAETETYQTNGVHPATSGYYQIADAVYRDINARL